jgi:hypothetical protein
MGKESLKDPCKKNIFLYFVHRTRPYLLPCISETACKYSIHKAYIHITQTCSPRGTVLLILDLCLGNESLKSIKR